MMKNINKLTNKNQSLAFNSISQDHISS